MITYHRQSTKYRSLVNSITRAYCKRNGRDGSVQVVARTQSASATFVGMVKMVYHATSS